MSGARPADTGAGRRRLVVALLLGGVALQIAGLLVAAAGRDLRAPQSEDMVPFTYLLATIASVLAAVVAMAGSVSSRSRSERPSSARTSARSSSRTRTSGRRSRARAFGEAAAD